MNNTYEKIKLEGNGANTDIDKDREIKEFYEKIKLDSNICLDPCFMTNMGCVNTNDIDKARARREDKLIGFVIMPFKPKIDVFYHNTLKPFFEENYKSEGYSTELVRADLAQRTGTIICGGICRQIQQADFIIADISKPNENVFYELGLAYGLGRKVILIYQESSSFGKNKSAYLLKGSHIRGKPSNVASYGYLDLNPIELGHPSDQNKYFKGTNYFWQNDSASIRIKSNQNEIAFIEIPNEIKNHDNFSEDIILSFSTHVKSEVGISLVDIRNNDEDEDIKQLLEIHSNRFDELNKNDISIKNDLNFIEFKEKIDKAYCLIVRTGRDCDPMAYFWLGYGHALGKNILPITKLHFNEQSKKEEVNDLAFDIRAQRHMTFSNENPRNLGQQLKNVLREIILKDFRTWSRKKFWDRILGNRGEVSIITGALHVDNPVREMVGDWDLRSASELSSYLSGQQYRFKIETPIYQFEQYKTMGKSKQRLYVESIMDRLKMEDKNCILIASPDVNPLTEIIFGRIYGIKDEELFLSVNNIEQSSIFNNDSVVIVKEVENSKECENKKPKLNIGRRFYLEEEKKDNDYSPIKRGLYGFWFKELFDKTKNDPFKQMYEYYSQEKQPKGITNFSLLAHLVVVKNTLLKDNYKNKDKEKYIVILNGVSGPATYALTHVITGGANNDFSKYDIGFEPNKESEYIIENLLVALERVNNDVDMKGVQCIIKVTVDISSEGAQGALFDKRLIKKWEILKSKTIPTGFHVF